MGFAQKFTAAVLASALTAGCSAHAYPDTGYVSNLQNVWVEQEQGHARISAIHNTCTKDKYRVTLKIWGELNVSAPGGGQVPPEQLDSYTTVYYDSLGQAYGTPLDKAVASHTGAEMKKIAAGNMAGITLTPEDEALATAIRERMKELSMMGGPAATQTEITVSDGPSPLCP